LYRRYTSVCKAVCASNACHLPSFLAAGPTPTTAGCCDMKTGSVGGAFKIDTFNQTRYISVLSESDTRERFLGVSNRVVAGVLVHTTRAATQRCASSRFAHLGPECASEAGVDLRPYGVDPVFLHTAALHDAELMKEYERYHGIKLHSDLISNFTEDCSPPSCGAHYFPHEVNERGAPYGFFHEKLTSAYDDGFSVFFDVNANEEQARNLLSYMTDGFFVDDKTRAMAVSTVTYNADLGVLSYLHSDFEFHAGGSIVAESQVQTLSVENYKVWGGAS
jgi:hypothetical protein